MKFGIKVVIKKLQDKNDSNLRSQLEARNYPWLID